MQLKCYTVKGSFNKYLFLKSNLFTQLTTLKYFCIKNITKGVNYSMYIL